MNFPPEWDVFPAAEFSTAGPRNAGEAGMELLAEVRPNGRILDHYRVTMGGSKILDIRVPLSSMMISPPASRWSLAFQQWPRDLSFRRNMSTTAWMEVSTLIEGKKAFIVDEEDEPVAPAAVLQMMEEEEKTASVRFAVIVGGDMRPALNLQCLPASVATLSGKPIFRGDNVPVINLLEWELNCAVFDGDVMAGPVPTLFATDPEEAARNITANAEKAHADLQRLAKMFLMPEYVDGAEAILIVKKPRAGVAEFPYKREKLRVQPVEETTEPQAKRKRTSQTPQQADAGEPPLMDEEELEEEVDNAASLIDEEEFRTSRELPRDPAVRGSSISDSDIRNLRTKHIFLQDFSDAFIRNTPIGDLMKIQSTALKARELERKSEADDKLAANKSALLSTFTTVPEGKDNRQSILHSARFLAGTTCSATRSWLAAREAIGSTVFPAVSSYDMGSVGLAGHVSAKGWVELHNLASTKLSIRMFSINNCGARSYSKKGDDEGDIGEVGEFKLALRVMRTAFALVHPWNVSVLALEGFFFQTSFCHAELASVDKKAFFLTKFVDYVLGQNADRWRDGEPFLNTGDLKTAWASFFGSQPQAQMNGAQKPKQVKGKGTAAPQQAARVFDPRVSLGICFAWNKGQCIKPNNACITPKGRSLKHICDHVPDPAKPAEVCGKEHIRKDFH